MAVSLLLAAYAYNSLGNAIHEVIGTVMFALLIAHNIFNRRWYGTITKRRREARSSISKAINLSLLVAMLSLLITSVIISQTVFSFLSVGTSFTARQAHTVAAYGALLIVALHLGLQWSIIMGLMRNRLAIDANNRLARLGSSRRGARHRCLWCAQPAGPGYCLEARHAGADRILDLSGLDTGAIGPASCDRRTGDLSRAWDA